MALVIDLMTIFLLTRRYRTVTSHPTGNSGAESLDWTVGDKANHKTWGIGTVVKISGSGQIYNWILHFLVLELNHC